MKDMERIVRTLDAMYAPYDSEYSEYPVICGDEPVKAGNCHRLYVGEDTQMIFDADGGYEGLYRHSLRGSGRYYLKRAFYPKLAPKPMRMENRTGSDELDQLVSVFLEIGVPFVQCRRTDHHGKIVGAVMFPTGMGFFHRQTEETEETGDSPVGRVIGVVEMSNAV